MIISVDVNEMIVIDTRLSVTLLRNGKDHSDVHPWCHFILTNFDSQSSTI